MRVRLQLVNIPDENGNIVTANGHKYTKVQLDKGLDKFIDEVISHGNGILYDESIIISRMDNPQPFQIAGRILKFNKEDYTLSVKLNHKHILATTVRDSERNNENRFYVGICMVQQLAEDGETISDDQINIVALHLIDNITNKYRRGSLVGTPEYEERKRLSRKQDNLRLLDKVKNPVSGGVQVK